MASCVRHSKEDTRPGAAKSRPLADLAENVQDRAGKLVGAQRRQQAGLSHNVAPTHVDKHWLTLQN